MSHRTNVGEVIEGTTPVITAAIEDEDGAGFKPTTLVLTLYDERTETIINAREAQDVLDTNGVTVTSGGAFEWQLEVADAAIVTVRAQPSVTSRCSNGPGTTGRRRVSTRSR